VIALVHADVHPAHALPPLQHGADCVVDMCAPRLSAPSLPAASATIITPPVMLAFTVLLKRLSGKVARSMENVAVLPSGVLKAVDAPAGGKSGTSAVPGASGGSAAPPQLDDPVLSAEQRAARDAAVLLSFLQRPGTMAMATRPAQAGVATAGLHAANFRDAKDEDEDEFDRDLDADLDI
jgi:hypothetical protein